MHKQLIKGGEGRTGAELIELVEALGWLAALPFVAVIVLAKAIRNHRQPARRLDVRA